MISAASLMRSCTSSTLTPTDRAKATVSGKASRPSDASVVRRASTMRKYSGNSSMRRPSFSCNQKIAGVMTARLASARRCMSMQVETSHAAQ